MNEVDLYNARYRLEQHLDDIFSHPKMWEIDNLSIIGENAHFTVNFYTKAITNSQINNEVYNIRSTMIPEADELYNIQVKIRAQHEDLIDGE